MKRGFNKISLEHIYQAARRLQGVINKTELVYSKTFSEFSSCHIYLKPENFQRTGSFKIRGAYNKISQLNTEEKKTGVIACSAGNHAQGVALAAKWSDIKSTIVMPEGAPLAKITATRNYGANVVLHGSVYDETYDRAKELQGESGAVFIHPFDDREIITGQGTVGLEIINELPEADVILVPIGGGGLISGISLAVKDIKPEVRIIGVEAAGAPSMQTSQEKGDIVSIKEANSIADGITVKTPGELTFMFCREYVDDLITVEEEEIAGAILMLLERAKMVVEGAGAVTLAALLYGKINCRGKNVVAVISGGNIDINIISRIIERGLVKAGRRIKMRTSIKDRPGHLQRLLGQIAVLDANVISVIHNHHRSGIPLDMTEVEIELEIRDREHANEVFKELQEQGYFITIL